MSIKIGDFVKGITNDYDITNTKMTRGVVTDVQDESIVVRVLDHDAGNTGIFTVNPEKFEVIGHQKQFDRAEVLKLLKDGCKKAILDYDLRHADLSNADLSHTDLSYTDLSHTDLNGAVLSGAILKGAVLNGAVLKCAVLNSAVLNGADLSYTDLSHADLSDTDLSYTDLNGAVLNGAILYGAVLNGAILNGADLRGADLDYSCYPLRCGSLHPKADKRLACQLAYHLCSMQCDDADYIKMRNSILDFANQFHRVGECGELEEREI